MTGTSRSRVRERGMALAVAIFALVVVGFLVAGAFFAGNLEQRTGRNAVFAAEAADAAESGVVSVLAHWNPGLSALAVGDSASEPISSPLGSRLRVSPSVVRLNDELFLIRSLGQRTDASGRVLAERTVASVARLVSAATTAGAAITVTQPLSIDGTAEVRGTDSAPAGWTGCMGLADVAAVRSAAGTGVAAGDSLRIAGVPKLVAYDSAITHAVFTDFGGRTFDELARTATVVVRGAPGVTRPAPVPGAPDRCNRADPLNWGEPRRTGPGHVPACEGYFPVVYHRGALTLSGGRGQGLLLVDGNLLLTGGFEWFGLVVATGGVTLAGNATTLTGALLAEGAERDARSAMRVGRRCGTPRAPSVARWRPRRGRCRSRSEAGSRSTDPRRVETSPSCKWLQRRRLDAHSRIARNGLRKRRCRAAEAACTGPLRTAIKRSAPTTSPSAICVAHRLPSDGRIPSCPGAGNTSGTQQQA